jgi:hypothetical protein
MTKDGEDNVVPFTGVTRVRPEPEQPTTVTLAELTMRRAANKREKPVVKNRPYLKLPACARVLFSTQEAEGGANVAPYSTLLIVLDPEANESAKAKWPSELRALEAVLILEGISFDLRTLANRLPTGTENIPESICIHLLHSSAIPIRRPV